MSEINKALAELASQKKQPTPLQRAVVPRVSSSRPVVWLTLGFVLSLAVGGWAVSQSQPEPLLESAPITTAPTREVHGEELTASPTQKILTTMPDTVLVLQPAVLTESSHRHSQDAKPPVESKAKAPATEPLMVAKAEVSTANHAIAPEQKAVQSIEKTPTQAVAVSQPEQSTNSMVIEQVSFTKEQLAEKAIARGEKALDANNLNNALLAYSEALRHTPNNQEVRQKLAALYFGKGDSRKAYELLQAGIALNPEGETLRIALSKMLIKANQNEAALSPLVAVYEHSSQEYLAMRAALAQKLKRDSIALESYQRLTQMESTNARWWLGLAIQQERAADFKSAQFSYQQALSTVGISNQSQRFVKDRLALLQSLESGQ